MLTANVDSLSRRWAFSLASCLVALTLLTSTVPAMGQETATVEDAAAETVSETASEAVEATVDAATDAVTDLTEGIADAATADETEAATEAADAVENTATALVDTAAAAPAAAADAVAESGIDFRAILGIIAIIVLPILIGNKFAKSVKMPEQGWKISLIIGSIALAVLCVTFGEFKGGPDLAGGITLVYELADTSKVAIDEDAEDGAEDGEASEEEQVATGREGKVDISRLIDALKQRVDPSGTKEVTIRRYGNAIEIIIPRAGPSDLAFIKKRITDLGQLEFRITASPQWSEDVPIIEKALTLSPSQTIVEINGKEVAKWVLFDDREFDENDSRLVQRTAGNRQEALVLLDRYDVTGQYLTLAAKGIDDLGKASVDFTFNSGGAARFGKLTGDNLPNQATGVHRSLGILLDEKILSAPSLNSRITSRGTISGGAMSEDEVDYIISILNAGSLPAALNKEPISEATVSPTLGATTIERGKKAMLWSLGGVLLFILFYYNVAGVVACCALAATILLVLGAMVALNAAFTLPGLAGLVLTVGMAVDANVLIYERIREELKKGAGLRMAIRNGFDRATTTIVDANVTTLLTGIVLYTVGTDQIRGFAVTLVLGILMSMFTSIFCSRVVFEIAERRRWIKTLKFAQILGETKIDFLGFRWVAIVGSLALIGLGLAGVFSRGTDMLNIDFTGGTSVTMVLNEDAKAPIDEVRATLEESSLGDKNLLVVERGETNTRYTVNTNLESVSEAETAIGEAFSHKLQSYLVEVGTPTAFEEAGGYTGTELPITFNDSPDYGDDDGLSHDSLVANLRAILAEQGSQGMLPQLTNPNYKEGSSQRFKNWTLKLGLGEAETVAVAEALKTSLESEPLFPLANKIGGQVASDLQEKAIYAALVSILGIIAYLWFRFQSVNFGIAAVIAVVHDVLITIGALALSKWVISFSPALAASLQLESFQISLPIVAALITVIGYSLNDTIVIFDRVREVRGKSPKITKDMINLSVNQTLSRTLLTSITTLIVVSILYWFGGPGIHGFAFALVVGVFVGTYSTVFIASPALLWLAGDEAPVGTSDKS